MNRVFQAQREAQIQQAEGAAYLPVTTIPSCGKAPEKNGVACAMLLRLLVNYFSKAPVKKKMTLQEIL